MRVLRAVPVTFWVTLLLLSGVVGASWWHARAVDAADARGYQRALDHARFDSALYAMADTAKARAAAKTDTVLQTVTQHATKIKTVRIPDTVRVAFPVVDTLVIESQALAIAVDSLKTAITKERAANKVSLDLRDNAIKNARLENARLAAQNAALSKRPTRAEQTLTTLGGLGVGLLAGKVL